MAPSRSSKRRSMAPVPTELSPLSRLAIKADRSSRRRSTLGLSQAGRSSSGTPGRQKTTQAANGSAKTNHPESRRSLVSVGVASNSWDDPSCPLSGSQGTNPRPGDVTSLSVQNMDLESPSLLSKSCKTTVQNTTSHSVREMELDSPNLLRPGTPTLRPGVSSLSNQSSLERLMLPADSPSPHCQDQVSLLLPTDTPSPANQALVLDSDDDDDMPPATQPVDNRVLKDVVVYVEVRCNDSMENRSKAVAKQLELLGAQVEPKLSREVTHVVFKDGKKSTLDRAIKKGVHLVSVLWVESCREKQVHVNEGLYPVSRPDEGSTPVLTRIRRYRSMQPKTFEEELAGSAERVRKRRRHHELANRWKTVTGTTPSNTPGNKATVYVEDTQDPNSEEMILPSMSLAIPDTPPNMREKMNQLMARQENQTSPLVSQGGAMSQKRLFAGAESDNSSNCEEKNSAVSTLVAKDNQQVPTDTVSGRNSQQRTEMSSEGGKMQRRQSRRLSNLPAKDREPEKSNSSKQSARSGSGKRRLLSTMNSEPAVELICPQEPAGSAGTNRVKKTVGVLSGKRDQTPVSANTVSRASVESQGSGTDTNVHLNKRMDSNQENTAAKRKWRATTDSSDDKDEQAAKKGKQGETDTVAVDGERKGVKTGAAIPHWDWDSDSSDGLGELAARASARALASLRQGSKKKKNLSNSMGNNDGSDSDDPDSKQKEWENSGAQNTSMTPEKKSNQSKRNQKAERKSRGKSLGAIPVEEDAEGVDLASSQYSVVEPLRSSRRSLEDFAPPQKTSLSRRSCKKGKDSSRCSNSRVRSSSGSSNSSGGTKSTRRDTNKQAQRQTKATRNLTSSDLDSSTSSSSTGATRLSCNRRSRQKVGKKEKPGKSIVMTSMHTKDQELVISVIKQLGGFCLERDVSERTTHVVSGSNRRTLNVLSAIARGHWLVSLEWVLKSCEVGRYVEEEPYELHEAFPASQESRLERQAAEGTYKQDLFSGCGLIYVSEQTSPPHSSLVRLVELCGGRISTSIRRARIVLGNPQRRTDALVVTELWVLDSITEHSTLPLDAYLVQPERTRRASSPEF